MVIHRFGGRGGEKHTLARDGWAQKTSCHYLKIPLLYAREDDQVISKLERLAYQSNIRTRLSQHAAFQRMIHQKQGRRLHGMIDRSHQPISEVALRNKFKALGYWVRRTEESVFAGMLWKFKVGQSSQKGNTFP